ncbi:ABC transporter permease [Asticcacaulis benevestitus]|uniref:Mannose-1-phosphate guanyltransferase n=1 Tax=Asticcacaulis benevestitus DSM 16100 = ATCC BAA-896 TaxID=1121022 RepID=V4P0Z6_9CAUL|nr:ABC transporter permease [Asticcacaulis benevestitus]ESQ81801.1 mannose-1-phosphate guanyltransferase [Asticcacaulis benevestitus DSM 16100 = ATCC BAA-896]
MSWLHRILAILTKEFIQMRRDRMTFGMMIMVPVIQLTLFGFAINSDPRHLPTLLYLEDNSSAVRSIVSGLSNSSYFDIKGQASSAEAGTRALQSGDVAFVVTVPAGFTRALLRGDKPDLLIEADASDPSAASNAIGMIDQTVQSALRPELKGEWAPLNQTDPPVNIVVHRMYNPEGISQYNIVPGLLGVILTMTMIMITSIAMTRETERGNMENLLAMPARPWEVMVGKITPYVGVGLIQTGIVLLAAYYVFHVPFIGSPWIMALGVGLFIIANLAVGFTFSTIARSQMQAMQMTFFFFLPSMMLSGFMFPFRGMPDWAQAIGQIFPLTHFLRIVRSVMLKGSDLTAMWPNIWPMLIFIVVAMTVAMMRYRSTLD